MKQAIENETKQRVVTNLSDVQYSDKRLMEGVGAPIDLV